MAITALQGVSKAAAICGRDGFFPAARRVTRHAQWRTRYVRRWIAGRWVELRGNVVRVDGLRFDVSHPSINTATKGDMRRGAYESAERELIRKHLPADRPVVELGGCVGVVSCITNRMLDARDRHVVVEANPRLIEALEKNRARTHAAFDVLHAAVAYGRDEIEFFLNDEVMASSTSRTGQRVVVPTTTLQTICRARNFERVSLVCDIEGSEIDLIAAEIDFLRGSVGWFFVEFHPGTSTPAEIAEAQARLADAGFELADESADTRAYRNRNL